MPHCELEVPLDLICLEMHCKLGFAKAQIQVGLHKGPLMMLLLQAPCQIFCEILIDDIVRDDP